MKCGNYNVWLDARTSNNHIETNIRFDHNLLKTYNSIGLGFEFLPKTFELWYNNNLRRFCVSVWFIALWISVPRTIRRVTLPQF